MVVREGRGLGQIDSSWATVLVAIAVLGLFLFSGASRYHAK